MWNARWSVAVAVVAFAVAVVAFAVVVLGRHGRPRGRRHGNVPIQSAGRESTTAGSVTGHI